MPTAQSARARGRDAPGDPRVADRIAAQRGDKTGEAAWLRLPPLSEYIRLYETMGSAVHPTKVIGISLNTYDMTEDAARRACEAASRETGLPATDPVRFDSAPLVEAVRQGRDAYVAARRGAVSAGR